MTWTPNDVPDLRGGAAVVTGANGGIGLEAARALASRGAHVVIASRDPGRGEDARRSIETSARGASLDVRVLDLASLASVRRFAEELVVELPRIDLLVNNAGVMGIPERATDDGFEMQLGVNHLGHFVLTRRLLPALLRGRDARVVTVTSFGLTRLVGSPVDAANPHLRGRYDPWRAYGRSKLANVHFALELERRLERAGASVRSLLAHPGLAHTDLQARSVREAGGLSQRFWALAARTVGMRPAVAAWSILRAATDPRARGGDLYAPRWTTFGPPVRRGLLARSRDPHAARVLWEVSERETGEPFDVEAIVASAP